MTTANQEVTRDEIRELIVGLLVDEVDVEPDQLSDSATMKDLDLDSLDLIEMAQLIRHKYGVRMQASDAEGVEDFGGVLDMIHRIVNDPDRWGEQEAEDAA
jgi:acyl carrier protein